MGSVANLGDGSAYNIREKIGLSTKADSVTAENEARHSEIISFFAGNEMVSLK